jgi:serine/threonine protein kinase
MLTDFGLSKEGVIDNYGAKSFCGSMAYLAPEMLKRVGHGRAVDWYHLGRIIKLFITFLKESCCLN